MVGSRGGLQCLPEVYVYTNLTISEVHLSCSRYLKINSIQYILRGRVSADHDCELFELLLPLCGLRPFFPFER